MNNYIISLKPLTPFFFGGETTFGEDNTSYFVQSNYLPQQTTILGLLRFELLKQNELLGKDPVLNNWDDLIGKKSFSPVNDEPSGYGAIKKISPVFLSNGKDHYLPQAMDWTIAADKKPGPQGCDETIKTLSPLLVSFIENGFMDTGKLRKKAIALKAGSNPYDPKYGIQPLWVNNSGNKMCQWQYDNTFKEGQGFDNGFFIKQQQVGIHRKAHRQSNDTGNFYKLASYRLIDEFAFSFFVTMELPKGNNLSPGIVTMGGERSTFEMTITDTTDSFTGMFTAKTFSNNHNRQQKALVLTSDAFADENIHDKCDFAITDTIPFRNIISETTKNGDYTKIRGGALTKSEKILYLLKRGSIFYSDDLSGIKKSLNNLSFEIIGYNHFIEL